MSLEFSAIHFLKLFKDGQMSPSLSYISALKTRHIINKSEPLCGSNLSDIDNIKSIIV